MNIQHLSLTNFRNFRRLETDLSLGPTLLIGANAQGKTSLLEAIHYLTGASSPHSSNDRQLINFLAQEEDTTFSRIVGEVHRGDRVHRLEIRLIAEEPNGRLRKEVLINGVKKRVGELAAAFNSVLFLPQDLDIIEGSPGGRRRFLDGLISQSNPLYTTALTEYGKALSQRNALLKQLFGRGGPGHQLDIWDEKLAEHGAVLLRGRALAIKEIEAMAQPLHRGLTGQEETLRLRYEPAFDPMAGPGGQLDLAMETAVDRTRLSEEQVRQGLLEALQAARQDEIERGVTRIGPHRDDLRFQSDGLDLRLYGSRGQNRTAILATKIAEVSWLRQRTGEWPVLLLDEVLAELDAARRRDLLSRVLEVNQAILTAADRDMFTDEFCRQATMWRVRGGTLGPYEE